MTELLQSDSTDYDIEEAHNTNASLDRIKALLEGEDISPDEIIIAAKVITSMPQIRIEGREQPLGQSVNSKILDQLGRIGSR